MKYTKPPLTFSQQAELLSTRGMTGDRAFMISCLESVSYYRLCGYFHPYRAQDPQNPSTLLDTFRPGTTFDEVWYRYTFDRELRLVVLDAIERIEIAVRSRLACIHATKYGVFNYANDSSVLPHHKWPDWISFLSALERESARSKDVFVKHFRDKYGDQHSCLPVWVVIELMTFGSMMKFYEGCDTVIKKDVANYFGVQDTVLSSWLVALNAIRNACAHHARLWNRQLGYKPMIPSKSPDWKTPILVRNDRMFGILTICQWSLHQVAPQSSWGNRVKDLIRKYPAIPLISMGFPANWDTCPIWA